MDRPRSEQHTVTGFWTLLGGPPDAEDRLRLAGPPGTLPSGLPVTDLAVGAVAAAGLAGAELLAARGGPAVGCTVHRSAVATAFTSERHLRQDGVTLDNWAPLSGFFRTADGWVRTHANYPHHEGRLLAALGLPSGSDRDAVAARLAERSSPEVEEAVAAAGGLAVAVRTPSEWAGSAPGRAAAAGPLVDVARSPGPGHDGRTADAPDASSPAAGVRVLDLTRVIAGPVAGRTLAYLGADVLRVDPPGLPELRPQHLDTGFGKRSTLLDLRSPADRRTFDALLADADVVLTGYRADAVDALGLGVEQLSAARPGLVVARLTAWGDTGPWRNRRGFDSLVQAATGIAVRTGDGGPGVLPAQALDHATGYLLAAAILRALAHRAGGGGGTTIRASLARTASWLLAADATGTVDTAGTADAAGTAGAAASAGDGPVPDPAPWLAESPSPYGVLRHAVPPFRLDGGPAGWATGPVSWGSSAPRWL